MSTSDSKSSRRSWKRSVFLVRNQSSFWAFCSSRLTLLLKLGILDDFVQSRSNLRVQHLEIWKILSSNWSRGLQFFQWINHIHLFDPKHSVRWKFRAGSHLGFESYGKSTLKNVCGLGNLSNCSSKIFCLRGPNMEFFGNSNGINKLIVDGLPANVRIGIVSLLCLSSLAER